MVRYLKRLKSSRLGRVQAFPMYGGLGMSAPSLHRESTDSLMSMYSYIRTHKLESDNDSKCSTCSSASHLYNNCCRKVSSMVSMGQYVYLLRLLCL